MEDFRIQSGRETRYRYTAYTYGAFGEHTGFAEHDGSELPTQAQLQVLMVQYSYDADGRLIGVTYPGSENGVSGLSYAYDEKGWLKEIYALTGNQGKNLLRSYTYTGDGKVSEIRSYLKFREGSLSDYILHKYDYDVHSRIARIEYQSSKALGTVLESYRYVYDKNSNILMEEIYNASLPYEVINAQNDYFMCRGEFLKK